MQSEIKGESLLHLHLAVAGQEPGGHRRSAFLLPKRHCPGSEKQAVAAPPKENLLPLQECQMVKAKHWRELPLAQDPWPLLRSGIHQLRAQLGSARKCNLPEDHTKGIHLHL